MSFSKLKSEQKRKRFKWLVEFHFSIVDIIYFISTEMLLKKIFPLLEIPVYYTVLFFIIQYMHNPLKKSYILDLHIDHRTTLISSKGIFRLLKYSKWIFTETSNASQLYSGIRIYDFL